MAKYARRRQSAGKLAGAVTIFWDLDNKMPARRIGFRATLAALKQMLLRECDEVAGVNIYANTRTLDVAYVKENGVPILGAHLANADGDETTDLADLPTVCPVCYRKLTGSPWKRKWQLRRHLEMHQARHQKRDLLRQSLGGRMPTSQRESFTNWNVRFIRGRQAAKEVLGSMGDIKLGDKNTDKSRHLKDIEGASFTPVPAKPQAADRELIYDLKAFIDQNKSGLVERSICLVSDDGGFIKSLREASEAHHRLCVVSTASRKSMQAVADFPVVWSDLMKAAAAMSKVSNDGPEIYFQCPYPEQ